MSPARYQVNEAIGEFSRKFTKKEQKVLFVGVDPKWDYKYKFDCQYETMDIKPSRHPDILGDIQDCPQIPNNSYDGIIVTGVYEYLQHHEKAIKEISRLLKYNGKLLICMPGIAYYGDKKPTVTLGKIESFLCEFSIDTISMTYYKTRDPYYFQVFARK